MRLDHVLSEGEAVNILEQLGFKVLGPNAFNAHAPVSTIEPVTTRIYLISHPEAAGDRALTVEQLCNFAEGCAIESEILKKLVNA